MSGRTAIYLPLLALLAFPAAVSAEPWIAAPQVIEGPSDGMIRGVVFEDLNGDGIHQPDEPGLQRVLVSNGLEVTMTGRTGAYALPVRADMDLDESVAVLAPAQARCPPALEPQHLPVGSDL